MVNARDARMFFSREEVPEVGGVIEQKLDVKALKLELLLVY